MSPGRPDKLLLLAARLFLAVLPAPSLALAEGDAELFRIIREEARAYEHGEGVDKDPAKAISIYCEAARAGDPEARYSLGWMHANGRGTARDDAIAAYYFTLAAEQGHEPSLRMLQHVQAPMAAAPPECMRRPASAAPSDAAPRDELDAHFIHAGIIKRLAPEYGIEPRLALAVARTESNFNPKAVSHKNAQGLMQLIPETSARFNVRQPFDPEQNIRGGLAYLRWLLAYYRGDVALVAAAYNAGEGAVNRYGGIPPYPETRGYVQRILAVYRQREHPFDPAITSPSPDLWKILQRQPKVKS